jgi:hypothetical protein
VKFVLPLVLLTLLCRPVLADDSSDKMARHLQQMRQRIEQSLGKKLDDKEWDRFARLMLKRRSGGSLTEDEKDFLRSKRKEWMGKMEGSVAPAKPSMGLMPLTDLGKKKYKEERGGLYGEGKNRPSGELEKAIASALSRVQALDAEGKPAASGKIGFISIGMSNTTMEFSRFKEAADEDKDKSPQVVVVDCAQGGKDAAAWVDAIGEKDGNPWSVAAGRLKEAGVSPSQVQVVWLKQALANPQRYGEFPGHAKKLQEDETAILQELKRSYPNLQLAYLSSRIYAGYASTSLNPEPYAYESGFAVRWLIQQQDLKSGTAPVALWGPYLWQDGIKGKDLAWQREDFGGDGTHPSESGQQKVVGQLLQFFKSDPSAKPWFLAEKKEGEAEPD